MFCDVVVPGMYSFDCPHNSYWFEISGFVCDSTAGRLGVALL